MVIVGMVYIILISISLQSELAQLLYPIFVHMYLNLVARGYNDIGEIISSNNNWFICSINNSPTILCRSPWDTGIIL